MIANNSLEVKGIFPGLITNPDVLLTPDDFFRFIHTHKTQIEQALLKHGALLFRDFPIESAQLFAQMIKTVGLGQFLDYIGGDSPRDKVEDGIYTSTEAPPNLHIPLHQELSFIKHFPRHIYFYCSIAPQNDGSTLIADARIIYKNIPSYLKQKFEEKQLIYTSRYYYKSKIMHWVNQLQRSHKSWVEVFETTEKSEVEQKCKENDFAWKWLGGDWLEIKQTRPAILDHPLTQEKVWFNQAHLYDFNPQLLGWKRYIAAKLFYFRKKTLLHEIQFADGTRVPRKDLYDILNVLDKNTVAFPWKKNDVLILDNILAMHGRATFSGKRRILTALTA